MAALSVKNRARSIALRWGPVTTLSRETMELVGLAVRYDEEDPATSETFVVRMAPGRAEAVDGMLGTAVGVATSDAGIAFVLDGRGTVQAGGRRHRLAGGRAIASLGDRIVVAGDQKLWILDGAGERVEPGPSLKTRALSPAGHRLLCACDDGQLVLVDGDAQRAVPVTDGKGPFSAIHLAPDGAVLAAAGAQLYAGTVDGVAPLCTASQKKTGTFEVNAVAQFAGRRFVSSKVVGLCVVDEGLDGKPAVLPLRPSIRAHTIDVRHGLMVASGALAFATTDDGVDFLTRDLAPFVRIAEKLMPRFLQTDDPAI